MESVLIPISASGLHIVSSQDTLNITVEDAVNPEFIETMQVAVYSISLVKSMLPAENSTFKSVDISKYFEYTSSPALTTL